MCECVLPTYNCNTFAPKLFFIAIRLFLLSVFALSKGNVLRKPKPKEN